MALRYEIVDLQTGHVVATRANVRLARRLRDRLDLSHGAIRYQLRYPSTHPHTVISTPVDMGQTPTRDMDALATAVVGLILKSGQTTGH